MDVESNRWHLIRGGRIYDHDGDIDDPPISDVLIDDDTIASVAPDIAAPLGARITDARGKLLIPGFVNAHYHSHDVLAKGMFEEMPFDVWTHHASPNNYGTRSLEEVRVRTLLGAAEALRNGITTIQDMLVLVPRDEAYLDTVLSAYGEIGIRVVMSITIRDRTAFDIEPFLPADAPPTLRAAVRGRATDPRAELEFRQTSDRALVEPRRRQADVGARSVRAATLLARIAGRRRTPAARARSSRAHACLRNASAGCVSTGSICGRRRIAHRRARSRRAAE
jgi:hypothetical protein